MSGGSPERPSLRARALMRLGGALIDAVLATTRFSVEGRERYDAGKAGEVGAIFVLWHGRLLPCSYYHRQEGLATLISQNRDGDYITSVVERWGYTVVRGSSSRGGSGALRKMVKLVRDGTSLAVTPDGPRGPRQKMKPGPLVIAQLTGAPLIPVTAGTARGWWFGSWDRFLLPKPFSRIRLRYGEPLTVPERASADELERLGLVLEERLDALTALVDEEAAR